MALLLMPLPVAANGAVIIKDGSPTRSAGSKSLAAAEEALADVKEILGQVNTCSKFFGGAGATTRVLDDLMGRIEFKRLPDRVIGIEMSGDTTFFSDTRTGYQYRLFEKVTINLNGAFYRNGNPFLPTSRVGSLSPNTREVRVLMLLHELGHLIKNANGQWLLEDDGGDFKKSHMNTKLVEKQCLSQIKELCSRSKPLKSQAMQSSRTFSDIAANVDRNFSGHVAAGCWCGGFMQ